MIFFGLETSSAFQAVPRECGKPQRWRGQVMSLSRAPPMNFLHEVNCILSIDDAAVFLQLNSAFKFSTVFFFVCFGANFCFFVFFFKNTVFLYFLVGCIFRPFFWGGKSILGIRNLVAWNF